MLGRRPRQQQSAVPIAIASPLNLTAKDFTANRETPTPDRLTTLATFQVPRTEIFELDTFRPFRMYIKTCVPIDAESAANGDIVVDLAALGINLIQTTRPNPATPSKDLLDINAWLEPKSGGDRLERTIQAVDYDANTVTIRASPTVEYVGSLYVLAGNGEFVLRAVQPSGGDTGDKRAVTLYNDTFGAIHEVDQARGETAPRLLRGYERTYPLAPKWTLALEVKTPHAMVWNDEAGHVLNLRGKRLPVVVTSQTALNKAVKSRLV